MLVSVKHAGISYPVEVDVTAPASVFKASIYQVTSIPPGEIMSQLTSNIALECTLSGHIRPHEGDGQGWTIEGGRETALGESAANLWKNDADISKLGLKKVCSPTVH